MMLPWYDGHNIEAKTMDKDKLEKQFSLLSTTTLFYAICFWLGIFVGSGLDGDLITFDDVVNFVAGQIDGE
jgi:hypothetical protein